MGLFEKTNSDSRISKQPNIQDSASLATEDRPDKYSPQHMADNL